MQKFKNIVLIIIMAILFCNNILQAQINMGATGLYIKTGTTVSVDSLVMLPATDITITGNALQHRYTPIPGTPKEGVKRVYEWDNAINYAGAMRIYVQDAELNGNSPAQLQIAYNTVTGNNGFTVTTSSNATAIENATLVAYTFADAANIKQVTAVNTEDALPLTLLYFSIKENNCNAELQWTTTSEINVSHFEIEQSTDEVAFTEVKSETAKAQSGENNYNITLPVSDKQVFYRLKIVDIDGKYSYSNIIALTTNCRLQGITIYPNPTKNILHIRNAVIGSRYEVYDNLGRRLISGVIDNVDKEISVSALAAGMYLLRVDNITFKFIKE